MTTRTHTIRLTEAARKRLEQEVRRQQERGTRRSLGAVLVDLAMERLDQLTAQP